METQFKILIVNHHTQELNALEKILKHPEFSIHKASSGKEALWLMLEEEFDLIVMELIMPQMDGLQALELIRGNKKSQAIPVIFTVQSDNDGTKLSKAFELSPVDYLLKPIEPLVINNKVHLFYKLYRQKNQIEALDLLLFEKDKTLKETQERLDETTRMLESFSFIDGITGIPNRRSFDNFVEFEYRRGIRSKTWLSLIFAEIDFFKQFLDNYGQQAGAECLKEIAIALANSVKRSTDFVARYSYNTFSIALTETYKQGTAYLAENMRKKVESLAIPHAFSPASTVVTITIGTATMAPTQEYGKEKLIDVANNALNQAIQRGRNQLTSVQL
jgi:diguanylate cyclase (GGDEF)-like protein